jgi:phosphoribosylformylglycinamidine synthase subunit PurQ / glutaminase
MGNKSVAVVVFPGTNRQEDMVAALHQAGAHTTLVAHTDTLLPSDTKLVVLPGGFSYGDYLRSGAMAARTPIMHAVASFASKGGYVAGICNGFQILCEAGLLAGALLPNAHGRFIGHSVPVVVHDNQSPFSGGYSAGQTLQWPAAHGDGRYVPDNTAPPPRVLYRYAHNINGSTDNIAGIVNQRGNVFGAMPHPENAIWPHQAQGTHGVAFFNHLLHYV